MKKKQQKQLFLFLIAILAIFIIITKLGFGGFSVISLSTIPFEEGGKVYWLYTINANSINEKVTFTNTNPNSYTKSDGTTIDPQRGLSVTLSKLENSCGFRVTKITKTIIPFILNFDYYYLNNPERTALVKIEDNRGNSKILDASVSTAQVELGDKNDGKGIAIVEAQGIIGGKVDCPNYENVALYYDRNNNLRIVSKSTLESKLTISSIPSTITTALSLKSYLDGNVPNNIQFTSSFTSIGFDGTEFLGTINFGTGQVTITADQDYFDSTSYTPPKEVDPQIDSINIPSEIKQDGTATMQVKISNKANTQGTVVVSASSDDFAINPSSDSYTMSNSLTLNYNLKAKNSVKDYLVTVEACSANQFGSNKCVTKTATGKLIAGTPSRYCGDGICQADIGETALSCNDCTSGINNTGGNNTLGYCATCDAFAQSTLFGWADEIVGTSYTCKAEGFIAQDKILGFIPKPQIPQTNETCVFSFFKYFLVPIALLMSLIFGGQFLNKFSEFKGKKGQYKRLGVNLILAIIIAFMTYYLWWVGIIVLLFLIVIKLGIGNFSK